MAKRTEGTNASTENVKPETGNASGTVQLTRNVAGRQYGETMPAERAEALGILDATRPFENRKTR